MAALAGGRPDEKLLRLADGAAGNPLYVTELVAALARSSSVTITDAGAAELTSGPRRARCRRPSRTAWASFPGRCARCCGRRPCSAWTSPCRTWRSSWAASVADLVPAVDEARAAGVLAESGSGLGFRHPLIRAALYEEMPVPVRAAWHRDAGRALAEAGAPADRVARQLLRAVDGPAARPSRWTSGC